MFIKSYTSCSERIIYNLENSGIKPWFLQVVRHVQVRKPEIKLLKFVCKNGYYNCSSRNISFNKISTVEKAVNLLRNGKTLRPSWTW